jgi:hypothetical protein
MRCLWEEVVRGGIQRLGADSGRAGAQVPGMHECPPAAAGPFTLRTPRFARR